VNYSISQCISICWPLRSVCRFFRVNLFPLSVKQVLADFALKKLKLPDADCVFSATVLVDYASVQCTLGCVYNVCKSAIFVSLLAGWLLCFLKLPLVKKHCLLHIRLLIVFIICNCCQTLQCLLLTVFQWLMPTIFLLPSGDCSYVVLSANCVLQCRLLIFFTVLTANRILQCLLPILFTVPFVDCVYSSFSWLCSQCLFTMPTACCVNFACCWLCLARLLLTMFPRLLTVFMYFRLCSHTNC
jgi:hypothetical protein